VKQGHAASGSEHETGSAESSTPAGRLQSVAFYLPQFHPIAENDEWWEPGFTEWHNVTRTKPRFRGHYQPHLPQDLGFYDLRLPETRARQAALAAEYGVTGFCYYHYWFNGRRLLEAPFEEVRRLGEPDFPFMLCWANENWTRRWDGAEHELLIGQNYGPEDDLAHIRHLAEAFADPRYIRREEKPIFLIYHASTMPDTQRTLDTWRSEYARLGLGELYLCRVEAHGPDRGDPRPLGFDAAVEFQPDFLALPPQINPPKPIRAIRRLVRPNSGYRHNRVYSYPGLIKRSQAKPDPGYPRFPCVTPSWDNSSRRKIGATILRDSTPALFEQWTHDVARSALTAPDDTRGLMFVNGWNEWAEGNHLEPDQRYGRAHLEAHRSALLRAGATVVDVNSSIRGSAAQTLDLVSRPLPVTS
jgi:hypothetical protein